MGIIKKVSTIGFNRLPEAEKAAAFKEFEGKKDKLKTNKSLDMNI